MEPPTPKTPSSSRPHRKLQKRIKKTPSQPDMSLREEQHIHLDSEGATHTGMEGKSRYSSKYLLLQVWCGLLTVAMVVMAALFISIKPKSTEAEVPTLKPDSVSPTVPTGNPVGAPLRSIGSSLSYIQLDVKSPIDNSWRDSPLRCNFCSLVLRNNSIHCSEAGIFVIYAQVTFINPPESDRPRETKSVVIKRNAMIDKALNRLVEGTFPATTDGSVWLAKIVSLAEGESISLDIKGEHLNESTLTFWGAYQLR